MDATGTPQERRQLQEALQAEADQVVEDLGLPALLGRIGQPHRVGSSRLGLMVWRDIDVTVVCDDLTAASAAVVDAAAHLGARPDVREVLFRKETGRFNLHPARYPDGLYLRLDHAAPGRPGWRLDIWFVDEPDRQPDLAHVRSLPARLTPQARDAILLVKHAWAGRDGYGTTVTSHDVYTAVLDDGVTDVQGFTDWLGARAATSR
ncbi:hypothetical protein [Kineococcus glutinatus]|uniref:Nucleotidyltransferase AbiEii toxin of type IV toxin-antitoxin system n=1 Tax=Kineococcus glutinatus TaxID=1070872 RepID=A0ABP9HGL1_9ACTN